MKMRMMFCDISLLLKCVLQFNITCEENLWKLTSVGTINCIGELMCLPLSGYISDKYEISLEHK